MRNLFRVNIFTYLLLILSFLAGFFREMLVVYLILLVHEFGHFFLMRFYSIKVDYITIYPYGGMIKSNMLINTNSKKVLLISLGGIISQFFLWGIVFCLFNIRLLNNNYYAMFCLYNVSIIIFNLLPIYPLDGFKILNSILELFLSFKYSIIISMILNLISLVLFFCYLYINSVSNYIIIIFMLFSFVEYIKNIKYVINKFYIERVIYDLKYNGFKSVKDIHSMFKNNYNYINGIGEDIYLKNKYSIFSKFVL